MKRRDLEHIVRAAADIADDDEIIVIGSQAILGEHPDALSKYVAAREKDYRFNHGVIEAGYVDNGVLLTRLATMPIGDEARSRIGHRIQHDFGATLTS